LPNGRVTRLGVNVFDPDGELVPPEARNATFVQFNQEQARELGDKLNSKFDSLEVGLERRYANRWSGRVSYTFAHCYDVAAIIVDADPRLDYGRCDRDNIHAFATSGNVDIWKGLGAGLVFRAYSVYPINETIGSDYNGDGTNNDRPDTGIHDLTRPILSSLDSRGVAVRNGIDGEKQVILDGRVQYLHRIQRPSWVLPEIHNDQPGELGNPTGNRNSAQFMQTVVANNPRSAQLGSAVHHVLNVDHLRLLAFLGVGLLTSGRHAAEMWPDGCSAQSFVPRLPTLSRRARLRRPQHAHASSTVRSCSMRHGRLACRTTGKPIDPQGRRTGSRNDAASTWGMSLELRFSPSGWRRRSATRPPFRSRTSISFSTPA
jgi:hypothetical protein